MTMHIALPDTCLAHLAVSVRSLRKARGMRQTDLADLLGLQVNTIYRLEHGQAPHVEVSTLYALAELFGVSLDALVGRRQGPLSTCYCSSYMVQLP